MRRLTPRTLRPWIVATLLLLGVLPAVLPALARAAESTAGLVIVDGDGAVGYALVTFEEPEISGMELLRRSGADPVTVSFGGLGEGVCGIGETGCAVDVCRRRMCQTGATDSPYWQSFVSDGSGAWVPLQLGASADRVRDGDVRLWAWTEAVPTRPTLVASDISRKARNTRNEIVWDGGPGDNGAGDTGSDSPLTLGIGLVIAAAAIAAVVTVRGRVRPA